MILNGPAVLNAAMDAALDRRPPKVGGIIEDETGWWQITHVEDGWAWLLGRDGMERQVKFGNLGHVTYEGD